MIAGVEVWPHLIRLTAERMPELDRTGFEARRWVRLLPVRRVLAQSRLPIHPTVRIAVALVTTEPTALTLVWREQEERGLLDSHLCAGIDTGNHHQLVLGQVLRLASDRKFPYDPAREAQDLLATLITGRGAQPVADRMLASLDPPEAA